MTREHRLSTIQIDNHDALLKTCPDFDFYKLVRVKKLAIEWQGNSLAVYLTAFYEQRCALQFLFEEVKNLCLPSIRDEGLWLSELEIEDKRGEFLVGVNYELRDFGSDFYLTFKRLHFLGEESKRDA